MKVAELRKWIGKEVIWDRPNSSLFPTKRGILEDVKSRNLLVSGNWEWLPDMPNLRLAPTQPEQVKP